MDRSAIFIDAGYLYAAAGDLCCGTRSRTRLLLDVPALNKLIVDKANDRCALPVLRTYWYDGAKNGIPTKKQQTIAAQPNIKLRLGRLNTRGQQKGVDALIYRDIMTLARERAIADGFLLSGDEDLREGVKAAQDQGVRITLVGVEAVGGFNQSRELVSEVDYLITLTKAELSPIISLRPAPPPAPPAIPGTPPPSPPTPTTATAPQQAGRTFAQDWVARATPSDLLGLRATRPRIPRTLDVELIVSTEATVGRSLKGDEEAHREMRRGFWAAVMEADMPEDAEPTTP